MEWGPHMDPTPLCLGVVSLLCSVSVRITPHFTYFYLSSIQICGVARVFFFLLKFQPQEYAVFVIVQ
jgi:hypothetical protein